MIRSLVAALLSTAMLAPVGGQPAPAAPAPLAAPGKQPARVEAGPTWSELRASQQVALAPLRAHWAQIEPNRKSKWLEVAQRFGNMPPAERQRVQARMAEWAAMSPTERGRARQSFQELRNLRADDRQALWDAYSALPPEQKRELAQRAKPAPRAPEPASSATGKRLVPVNPVAVTVKPVTPTVVQAKPGVSTTLVTKTPNPPAHHQGGLPKITATAGFVNPSTLLPSRGPQGAAALSSPVPAAASAASAAPDAGQ